MPGDPAAFWNRMARRYARMQLADPEAYEATLARVLARLSPADHVLEIGCGTGQTAIRLAPAVARYTATDLSPAMIGIARDRPEGRALAHLDFAVADPEGAPRGPFDAVLAFNLLHLLPDLPAGLAAIRTRLRPALPSCRRCCALRCHPCNSWVSRHASRGCDGPRWRRPSPGQASRSSKALTILPDARNATSPPAGSDRGPVRPLARAEGGD
jgi:SAM-dependent methyltransferase